MKPEIKDLLNKLGIQDTNFGACVGGDKWLEEEVGQLESISPNDGSLLAKVNLTGSKSYEQIMEASTEAYKTWQMVPAPRRGLLVKAMADALRINKDALGSLVSLEMGKIKAEGDGEVQEMIDIADFAVGLSRQLYGLTMHSERPLHRMYEQWHPLGVVGIISAFNFPVAVWSWNAFLAAICGNISVWKPSPKTPLTAIAVQHICNKVLADEGFKGIFNLIIGSNEAVGEAISNDPRIPLVSFTGSTKVGKHVAQIVHGRLGKTILELGGNNALIIDENANLEMALRAVLFGSVGTAGQRCTSTRRVIIHEKIYDLFKIKLVNAYTQVRIGDPLDKHTLMGPLIDEMAIEGYFNTIKNAINEGAILLCGGSRLESDGYFVTPTIIEAKSGMTCVQHETFAPIVFLIKANNIKEAIKINNEVPQGLSSSLFTDSILNSELFLSHLGSDCGIANINIGTSGAEIGGAFGGEKETGGGRESGSDAWKGYMRRQTNTINWGKNLPLAQGIEFNI